MTPSLKKLFPAVLVLFGSWSLLEASHVERNYKVLDVEGKEMSMQDTSAKFRLKLHPDSVPLILEDPKNLVPAWVFQFSVENNQGVEIEASRLNEGDFLLEDMISYSGALIKKAGTVIDAQDLIYLRARGFRQYYQASGEPLESSTFKVGDLLNVYKKVFDLDYRINFEKSGLETVDGENVISFGTAIDARLLALLRQEMVMPVKVRQSVLPKLEAFLRVNWPDEPNHRVRRYWVTREGVKKPLFLLSYQIKEGDVPYGAIVLADGTIICDQGKSLKKDGPKNSIEALDRHPHASMLYKVPNKADQNIEIESIDPLSGAPTDERLAPGELVTPPINKSALDAPLVIKSPEAWAEFLLVTKHSYARAYNDKTPEDKFPKTVYLTRYATPLHIECPGAEDTLLDVLSYAMKGEYTSQELGRTITFTPFVYQNIPAYPYIEEAWTKFPLSVPNDNRNFYLRQAHDILGGLDDMTKDQMESAEGEIKDAVAQSTNFIHPSRLKPYRIPPKTALTKDIYYFNQGQKVLYPAGTELSEELRKELEMRAVSPVYIEPENGDARMLAQDPHTLQWINKPMDIYEIRNPIQVDHSNRGIAAFKQIDGRVNKLELVIFGLSNHQEPVSGWYEAFVVTYRKVGDEYFQRYHGWKLESQGWRYLPNYAHGEGQFSPKALKEESAPASGGGGLFDDEGF